MDENTKRYLRGIAWLRTHGMRDAELFSQIADLIPWFLETKNVCPQVCAEVKTMVAGLKEDAQKKFEERSEFLYRMKLLEFAVEGKTVEEYMTLAETVLLEATTS